MLPNNICDELHRQAFNFMNLLYWFLTNRTNIVFSHTRCLILFYSKQVLCSFLLFPLCIMSQQVQTSQMAECRTLVCSLFLSLRNIAIQLHVKPCHAFNVLPMRNILRPLQLLLIMPFNRKLIKDRTHRCTSLVITVTQFALRSFGILLALQ